MSTFTVSSKLAQQMLAGLTNRGIDATPFLTDAGIDPRLILADKSRIPVEKYSRLGQLIISHLEDETVGLLNAPQRIGTFKYQTYSTINAKTVGEAMVIGCDFSNTFHNTFHYSLCTDVDFAALTLLLYDQSVPINPFIVEYILVIMHRYYSWLCGETLAIEGVHLAHSMQSYQEEYQYFFLGAPIYFNSDKTCLLFSKTILDSPIRKSFRSLKRLLKDTPISLLTQTLNSTDIASQTRDWLERSITKNNRTPDIEEAASYFKLSPQTYRRKLNKHSTTFKMMKQQVRRDIAIDLLVTKKLSIEEISCRLGFSETSTFIRAFKSWTGFKPTFYKKRSPESSEYAALT